MKVTRWAVWLLDESLDRVPRREGGRWYRRGCWGCQLRLWKLWWKQEDDAILHLRRADEDGWIAARTLERNGK